MPTYMAKSDSFFVRATVALSDGATNQTPIDLGFAVDALGKSVVRVHNVAVQYNSGYVTSGNNVDAFYELGTQSAATFQGLSDKSIFATGRLISYAQGGGEPSPGATTFVSQDNDIAPQDFTNGYLVAVDQLYLRGGSANAQGSINIIMECTVETMSQSAAMALSLSQQ